VIAWFLFVERSVCGAVIFFGLALARAEMFVIQRRKLEWKLERRSVHLHMGLPSVGKAGILKEKQTNYFTALIVLVWFTNSHTLATEENMVKMSPVVQDVCNFEEIISNVYLIV